MAHVGTLEQALQESGEAEAYAYGKAVDPATKPKPCRHSVCGLDCITAIINDERGEVASREVRVRVRCMECGVPMAVDLDRVRRPKDGELHGIILVVTPEEDD